MNALMTHVEGALGSRVTDPIVEFNSDDPVHLGRKALAEGNARMACFWFSREITRITPGDYYRRWPKVRAQLDAIALSSNKPTK